MKGLLVFVSACCLHAFAMDNLKVAFEWKVLDFAYPSEEKRQEAIDSKEFIPENNLPLGLEVYKDRLFITVPRWKKGVPASLTYINITDTARSPKLRPFPSWEAHARPADGAAPEIVSPFRVRADRCGRLWVLDTGLDDILGDAVNRTTTRLLVYNLTDDAQLREYRLPADQVRRDSFFANIAVEERSCDDAFAYVGDLGKPGLVVYSWAANDSWRVRHNFFHIDPLAGEFNVDGVPFVWTDGVFGLALSPEDARGFSTLYFHPLVSTNEFAVNTSVLRDRRLATGADNYRHFRLLGSRGPKAQSGVSFLDHKTNVLFYALLNLNAVACWRTTNPAYTMQSQGRVYMNNVTMVFPNDIKVDTDDNLWVLSDRLARFVYLNLDGDEVNFRVLTAPVREAINGTACDPEFKPNPDMMGMFKPARDQGKQTSAAARQTAALAWALLLLGAAAVGGARLL